MAERGSISGSLDHELSALPLSYAVLVVSSRKKVLFILSVECHVLTEKNWSFPTLLALIQHCWYLLSTILHWHWHWISDILLQPFPPYLLQYSPQDLLGAILQFTIYTYTGSTSGFTGGDDCISLYIYITLESLKDH